MNQINKCKEFFVKFKSKINPFFKKMKSNTKKIKPFIKKTYSERIKPVIKKLNPFYKITQYVLLVFLILMMFLTIFSVKNLNEHSGKGIFGYKFFIVLSDSMKPEFQSGDMIIIKKIDSKDLKIGDIVTFYSSDPQTFIVTHKIVDKNETKNTFITKGTNVEQNDERPVSANNVIGKYQLSIPKIGYFFEFIKTPTGYITFIFIPFFLLTTINGYKFFKSYKEYKNEQKIEKDMEKRALEEEKEKNKKMLEELKLLKEQINKASTNS